MEHQGLAPQLLRLASRLVSAAHARRLGARQLRLIADHAPFRWSVNHGLVNERKRISRIGHANQAHRTHVLMPMYTMSSMGIQMRWKKRRPWERKKPRCRRRKAIGA